MDQPGKGKRHLLGLGLDNEDGHVRVTRGDNFSLYVCSEATHERMQETCLKLNEKIRGRGKTLDQVSGEEMRDLFHEIS